MGIMCFKPSAQLKCRCRLYTVSGLRCKWQQLKASICHPNDPEKQGSRNTPNTTIITNGKKPNTQNLSPRTLQRSNAIRRAPHSRSSTSPSPPKSTPRLTVRNRTPPPPRPSSIVPTLMMFNNASTPPTTTNQTSLSHRSTVPTSPTTVVSSSQNYSSLSSSVGQQRPRALYMVDGEVIGGEDEHLELRWIDSLRAPGEERFRTVVDVVEERRSGRLTVVNTGGSRPSEDFTSPPPPPPLPLHQRRPRPQSQDNSLGSDHRRKDALKYLAATSSSALEPGAGGGVPTYRSMLEHSHHCDSSAAAHHHQRPHSTSMTSHKPLSSHAPTTADDSIGDEPAVFRYRGRGKARRPPIPHFHHTPPLNNVLLEHNNKGGMQEPQAPPPPVADLKDFDNIQRVSSFHHGQDEKDLSSFPPLERCKGSTHPSLSSYFDHDHHSSSIPTFTSPTNDSFPALHEPVASGLASSSSSLPPVLNSTSITSHNSASVLASTSSSSHDDDAGFTDLPLPISLKHQPKIRGRRNGNGNAKAKRGGGVTATDLLAEVEDARRILLQHGHRHVDRNCNRNSTAPSDDEGVEGKDEKEEKEIKDGKEERNKEKEAEEDKMMDYFWCDDDSGEIRYARMASVV
ncbi:MAG: hypothetical protein Q9220_004858 [cf. Caloplaca sp. 1 TL-2023]